MTADAINVSTGNKVAFYGTAEKYLDTTISGGTAQCYIYGNIMSLINATDFASATALTEQAAFQRLFNENTCLLSHPSKKLVLPAITLTNNCYTNMFYGCTGLTTAPELPATTLANYCYSYMFSGCTGLTTAPALPATTLAVGCYTYMFKGCAGLTTAPALPATTLANSCYASMFNGCAGLTTAPALPATILANYCYDSMFYRCAGLTTAPALPATTLAYGCYEYMFYDCTGLTTAPELPATTLANMCYMLMFAGCTGLTTAPALPATTLAVRCYTSMFSRCKNLNAVTCLATDISATYATANWLDGVADTGTFTKAPGMTGWETDSASGIPEGWTVEDYTPTDSETPLTLEAKTDGTILVNNPKPGMQYSLNGGPKTDVTTTAINVSNGDKVAFYGNANSYQNTVISGGTAQCYIYGNIMSLINATDFASATALTEGAAFQRLFNENTCLLSHPSRKLVPLTAPA